MLTFFAMFFSLTSESKERKLKVGMAQFPPFSYLDNQGNPQGLEVEIIRHCFQNTDTQVEFLHYPFGRLPIALKSQAIDAQIVTLPDSMEKNANYQHLYFSDIVAPEYQVVAISLAKNNFNIKSINDLQGKTIVAHQRANQYYGQSFQQLAKQAGSNYKEFANQMNQIHLLYNDMTQVIIIGKNIFEHLRKQADFDTSAAINVAHIFGDKRGFHNAFYSEKARDVFNQCLAKIKENGVYKQLVKQAL